MAFMNSIREGIRNFLFVLMGKSLSLIPKKKKLVLLTAWMGEKYIDNTKYVYEYLLDHSDYRVVWMTNNDDIFRKLKEENKPVSLFKSIKGVLLQIRAEAVFSTIQLADYNCWLLSRCIWIDLGHGHPIKDPGKEMQNTIARKKQRLVTEKLDFYSIVASSRTKENYRVMEIPQSHIFVSDFARNDVLVTPELQRGNTIVNHLKENKKAIVYMPTHRAMGAKPMHLNEILPLNEIEMMCIKYNYIFFIKKHFYHRHEKEDLKQYTRIIDITNEEDIDPQVLLCQADILISDYSACYIDYMLLKRPIIFYQYDIEDFKKNERSLYYDFEKINIAPIAYDKEDLITVLDESINGQDIYMERRMKFAHDYYFDNVDQKNGCQKVKIILDHLMNNR